jgi:hypothetical protein
MGKDKDKPPRVGDADLRGEAATLPQTRDLAASGKVEEDSSVGEPVGDTLPATDGGSVADTVGAGDPAEPFAFQRTMPGDYESSASGPLPHDELLRTSLYQPGHPS